MKDMLYLCIEIIFGLISGWRNLERIFTDCRSSTVILVHSKEEVGEQIKEKEDSHYVINAEDQDNLLRNSLLQVLFVFVVKLFVIRLRIVQR
jgi:hypothetical protein